MNNIEIKRGKIKRSVESIIDESAIDHQYNYEVQELRKSFNMNIRDLNTKIKEQQRQIERLSLLVSQKEEISKESSDKSHRISLQLSKSQQQNLDLKRNMNQLKKRLQHVQYKLEGIQSNRVAANIFSTHENDEEEDINIQKAAKKQAYSEIHQIMKKKIRKFTQQMKIYPIIPVEAERCIEGFLEQILYINPQQLKHQPFENTKNRKNGKISDRKPYLHDKLSDIEEWQKLERSVQKLKNIRQSVTPGKNQKKTPEKRYYERMIPSNNDSSRDTRKTNYYHYD